MTSATNDHNYSIHFSYDNMGNQTSITDALGNTFVYEYNNIGKKIKITDPLNRVTINEYDGKGHLQKVTNPLGISRKIEFSANGNPQKAYDAKGTVIGSFEYDSAGNAISRVITQIQQTSSYDKDGRELTNGYLWSENGISKNVEVIKEYDDAGNVSSRSNILVEIY